MRNKKVVLEVDPKVQRTPSEKVGFLLRISMTLQKMSTRCGANTCKTIFVVFGMMAAAVDLMLIARALFAESHTHSLKAPASITMPYGALDFNKKPMENGDTLTGEADIE